MTIARVEGGLGSQMFAYAAARRLALKHGAQVLIDARNYRTYEKFQFELDHFDLDAVLLTDEQADELCSGPAAPPVVRPAHLHVDRAVLDLATPFVQMVGNYLSEDYFSDVSNVLRQDFTRITEPADYAVDVRGQLDALRAAGHEPVAVHIRRGDYVTEPATQAFHGSCTAEYYANAFALVVRFVARPWFVIFSNDQAWASEHFAGPGRTITRPPEGTAPIEDMMLMAACSHHVLANSGYSWWGAWLAGHPDQVVIGPRPFIADRSVNSEDMMPRHWIGLGTQPR